MSQLLAPPPVGAFPQPLSRAVEESTAAFFKPHGLAQVPSPDRGPGHASGAGIMSAISFVGDYQWAFALSFPEGTAVAFAQAFAGFPIPFDSPDMGDVVGEIVNVIAGDVVGRLSKIPIAAQMSLPTTVRGDNVDMLVPSDASTARITFRGPNGACWCDLIATPLPVPVTSPEPDEPAPTPPPVSEATKSPPRTAAEEAALAAWAAAEAEAERQLAEQDAAEAALRAAGGGATAAPTATAAAGPVPAGRAPSGRFVYLAIVFACGGWGAAAGLLVAGKKPVPPAPAEHAPQANASASAAPAPGPVAQLDGLILAGRFADGLQLCLDTKSAPGLSATGRALREGLCLEGTGRWGEAAGAYRTAEADPNVVVWAVAMLGQARCAVQDESYALAKVLTDRVLLRSGHPDLRAAKLTDEVAHLRARVAVLESGGAALPRDATARPLLSRSASNGLDWLGRAAEPTPAPARDHVEVHRTLAAPDVPQVTVALSSRATLAVLRVVATTAGWKLSADDRTAKLLNRELGALEVDHMPLPEFLDALTAGTGVAWKLEPGVLILTQPK